MEIVSLLPPTDKREAKTSEKRGLPLGGGDVVWSQSLCSSEQGSAVCHDISPAFNSIK